MRPHLWLIITLTLALAWQPGPASGAAPKQSPIPCPPPLPIPLPLPPDCQSDNDGSSGAPKLCLRLALEPGSSSAPGRQVRYTVSVANPEAATAHRLRALFSYDAVTHELLDAAFTPGQRWVRTNSDGVADLDLGTQSGNSVVTATLTMRVKPGAAIHTASTAQVTAHWGGAHGASRSNAVRLVVGAPLPNQQNALLQLTPVGTTEYRLAYDAFTPDERVALWYQDATGQNRPLKMGKADAAGKLNFIVANADLTPGQVTIVALGTCSRITATATVSVPDAP